MKWPWQILAALVGPSSFPSSNSCSLMSMIACRADFHVTKLCSWACMEPSVTNQSRHRSFSLQVSPRSLGVLLHYTSSPLIEFLIVRFCLMTLRHRNLNAPHSCKGKGTSMRRLVVNLVTATSAAVCTPLTPTSCNLFRSTIVTYFCMTKNKERNWRCDKLILFTN
jgi:hypothetical protein